MSDLVGMVGIPGALLALMGVAVLSVRLYKDLQNKSPEPSGGSWQANISAALGYLAQSLTAIGEGNEEVRQEMAEIKGLISKIEMRMGNLPTSLDLNQAMEKGRHDVRGYISPMALAVERMRDAFVRSGIKIKDE